MRCWTLLAALAILIPGQGRAAELKYKDRLLTELVRQVPGILETYDPATGHFGKGIWLCTDQNPMYSLTVAYATPAAGNPYHRDAKLLEVIMKAGDALIADMDTDGRWVFRKKDGSTWGMIWMPWTYSRWIRSFQLIRDDMPPERREAWAKALTLGYTGVSRRAIDSIHNISTHHAMGLYVAGQVLDRPEWRQQAADFLVKVAGAQTEAGCWSEGGGPVIVYDAVYLDALGAYYAISGDARVLPSLEKAATFHFHFTYPDGSNVETIDQRNPYSTVVNPGNVGYTFSPIGRAYLARQWSRCKDRLSADLIASLLLYGQEGPLADQSETGQQVYTVTENHVERAAIIPRGPWFVCLSAYTTPLSKSRWIQDRQNFISIYHEATGLILGGGNTKLQPAWSNFTVGDVSLLAHKTGDENPDFFPKGSLIHVPQSATLVCGSEPGLDLTYGEEQCRIRLHFTDDRTLTYRLEATTDTGLPVAAHVTLLPRFGQSLETGRGEKFVVDAAPLDLPADRLGGSMVYAGYRLRLPESAELHWPRLPHNPYQKDGHAGPSEGRIEISVPFDPQHHAHEITLEILTAAQPSGQEAKSP